MGLSVIIPTKTMSNLVPCLRAVQDRAPGARIIVIDDGLASTAGLEPAVTVVAGAKPFVYARNCNIGIRAAGEDDVVLLNDDAILLTAAGFSVLQSTARAHPAFGVIGAVTNVTGQPLQRPMGKGLREVEHIAFVCVLIPRRTINEVGLLDERYALDYGVEDLDYCTACRRAGLKVGVHDLCYVDHSSLRSTFRGDPYAPGSFFKNKALYDQKWSHC